MATISLSSQAAHQVLLHLPELVTPILFHLPLQHLLRHVRLTCRTWRDLIATVRPLREKLFLAPQRRTPEWVMGRFASVMMNPLFFVHEGMSLPSGGARGGASGDDDFLVLEGGSAELELSALRAPCLAGKKRSSDAVVIDATAAVPWESMLISQPPVSSAAVYLCFSVSVGMYGRKVVEDEVEDPSGLKIGKVLGKVREMLRGVDVDESKLTHVCLTVDKVLCDQPPECAMRRDFDELEE